MTVGFNMLPLPVDSACPAAFVAEIPWAISLAEVGPPARDWVGAKAYRLAQLAQAGFQVPTGYCITISAYQRYRAVQGSAAGLPGELREEILRLHRALNLSTVAVRSSALDEDLQQASAAGIYPTYLNIRHEDDLLTAIANCFMAANCEPARRYRRLHRQKDEAAMAVLVQAQIDATSAGILFSADPISGNRDQIHINAIFGLGEPLASGELTPDHYVQDRQGRLIKQFLAPQPWMETSVGRLPLPASQQNQSTLGHLQLLQLNRLAKRVEQHERMPVDIEFAFDAGGLQLLQARPITSRAHHEQQLDQYIARERQSLLKKLSALRLWGRIKQPCSILSNGNIAELLPSPTPMSFGLFEQIFAGHSGAIARGRRRLGYRVAADAGEGLFQLVAGQPFFLLEIDAQTYDTGLSQPIERIHQRVEQNPSLANYPELGLYEQLLSAEQAEQLYPAEEALARVQAQTDFNRLQRKHAARFDDQAMGALEQRWRDNLQQNQAICLSELDLPQLVSRFERLVAHLQQETCSVFVSVARLGFYFYDLCRVRLQGVGEQEQSGYLAELFQGLQRTPISDQYRDLEQVRDGCLTLDAYLERHGHFATNELEVSLPRYQEDPEPLLELLRERTAEPKPTERSLQELRAKRLGRERALCRKLPRGSYTDFWQDLRLAQRFLPLREHVKYVFLAEYALLRATLLEIETRLKLQPGDIFYLRPQELGSGCQTPDGWTEIIAQRRQDRQLASALAHQHRLPAVLFEDQLEQLGAEQPLDSANSWRGQAVSPGIIEGTACVVETLEAAGQMKMELGPEQILVIPSLNLGLSALLGELGGLIVETGGLLAHSACQARERGIPAAVLPGATAQLQSGDRIRLDGANGLIQMA